MYAKIVEYYTGFLHFALVKLAVNDYFGFSVSCEFPSLDSYH